MNYTIISSGRFLPERIVTNNQLSEIMDTSDEWIRSRTGIITRHIAVNETTSYMGEKAAERALNQSSIRPNDIDLVICATLTPDISAPMVASRIKKHLNMEKAVAFDINGNCSGFLYAFIVTISLMESCGYQNALVIGSDTSSQLLNWNDRSTSVLFGDGAGALLVSKSDRPGILSTYMNGIIDRSNALLVENHLRKTPFSKGNEYNEFGLKMDGGNVMKFAKKEIMKAILSVIEKADVALDEISLIIPHQANNRIIQSAIKSLQFDSSKVFINIDKYANTSSATIPIAYDEAVECQKIKVNEKIIMVAFGGGLSSAAILIEN